MEVFIHAATQMLILFLLIAGGVIARKKKLMDDRFDTMLSQLIMAISLPCLILSSVLNNDSLPEQSTIGLMFGYSTIAYIFMLLVAWLIPKAYPKTSLRAKGAHSFMIAFGNVGFIGFPVLGAIFGHEAVLYGAILNIPFNIAVFTVGVAMVQQGGEQGREVQKGSLVKRLGQIAKSLLSPCMISCFVAMILALAHITDVGGIIGTTTSYMGQLTVPGSMLIVGSSLAKMPVKSMLGHVMPYVTALIRLLVLPLCIFFVFRLFVADPLILGVLTISSAMPVATMGTILCLVHGGDTETMMRGTFITTVLSLLTIPLLAMLVV